MSVPVIERVPVPQEVGSDPLPGLLVLVGDGDDLVLRLAVAADASSSYDR